MNLDLTKLYTQAIVSLGTAVLSSINFIKTVGEIKNFNKEKSAA